MKNTEIHSIIIAEKRGSSMAQLIAELYEIEQQIGAGGGGVVYLGRHIRLDKKVVLKADKRTLQTAQDALRREVDMLKGLSQTYIPQVYDFVQENGVVYTVMDYIEGESFDKLLARQQRFPQREVIKWACQLLEALSYLHSQGEHGILHGDIKPANIMLRPTGDICLIDFNIALALGEDGAVKVGFSRGYASPEHYGIEFVRSGKKTVRTDTEQTIVDTDVDQTLVDTKSAEMIRAQRSSGAVQYTTTGSGKKTVYLDVRSDIYSLGATLYHLFSGVKPAQKADEVESLSTDACSEQISQILQKAMAPNPADRFQTADEMLEAFLQLRKKDKRVIRRRRKLVTAVSASVTFLAIGGFLTFAGLKQMEQHQNALALAAYAQEALQDEDRDRAVALALKAIPQERNVFQAPITAEAQKALTDSLGIYCMKDGFQYVSKKELPSAPFKVVVSPEGSRYAVIYAYELQIFDSNGIECGSPLTIQKSALSDGIFIDENTIAFAAENGVSVYDLESGQTRWSAETATTLSLSGDGEILAAVNRDAQEVLIYRTKDGTLLTRCDLFGNHLPVVTNDIFADPQDYIFTLNWDGSMLAVSFDNGGLQILNINDRENDLILYDASENCGYSGGFCGDYFAFGVDSGNGNYQFGIVDAGHAEWITGLDSDKPFHVQANEQAIYLSNGKLLEQIDPVALEETELAYLDEGAVTEYCIGNGYYLIATDQNQFYIYNEAAIPVFESTTGDRTDFLGMTDTFVYSANRDDPFIRLLKLETHADAQMMKYDAREPHSEARISADGQTVMLFSFEKFSIYDQQFMRQDDNSYLEVIWYDGMTRRYSAGNGTLISEEQCTAPDKSLLEEFVTDRYRIVSSLHDAPQVYDRKTDRFVANLDEDAYLTYVTQIPEGIVVEYVTAEGQRYGYLLNEKLEKLAYLPDLCDVYEHTFIFDDQAGNLRSSRIFTLNELIQMAEEKDPDV